MGEEPKVSTRVQVRIKNSRKHYDNVQVSMEDPMQNFDNVINIYAGVEDLHRHNLDKVKNMMEDYHNITVCLIILNGSLLNVVM